MSKIFKGKECKCEKSTVSFQLNLHLLRSHFVDCATNSFGDTSKPHNKTVAKFILSPYFSNNNYNYSSFLTGGSQ